MDKWDLFPHGKRDNNRAWWAEYEGLHNLISTLHDPAGTISEIKGMQDLVDASTAATNPANGAVTEPPTSTEIRSPNGAAVSPQPDASAQVSQNSQTRAAADRWGGTQSRDDIPLATLPRIGTAPAVVGGHHIRSDTPALRRHSVHAGPHDRPFQNEPLGNSAFFATNMLRQRRRVEAQHRSQTQQTNEALQESDNGSSTRSSLN